MSLADINRVASGSESSSNVEPSVYSGRGELKQDHGVQERDAKQPEDEAKAKHGADLYLAIRTKLVLQAKCFIYAIL